MHHYLCVSPGFVGSIMFQILPILRPRALDFGCFEKKTARSQDQSSITDPNFEHAHQDLPPKRWPEPSALSLSFTRASPVKVINVRICDELCTARPSDACFGRPAGGQPIGPCDHRAHRHRYVGLVQHRSFGGWGSGDVVLLHSFCGRQRFFFGVLTQIRLNQVKRLMPGTKTYP